MDQIFDSARSTLTQARRPLRSIDMGPCSTVHMYEPIPTSNIYNSNILLH